MSLGRHLVELRKRLVLAVAGILVGAVAGWFVYDRVFALLQEPLLRAAEERGTVVAINFEGAVSALDMRVMCSFFLGVLVSSPWWLYQLWAFVTPGLTRRERGYSLGFLGAAVPLFAAGAALAWWVLPRAMLILTEFVPEGALNLMNAQVYLGFVMRLVLAFGLAFVLPVVMVALNAVGLVRARTLLGGWRWAVMLAFVFSAVTTPTGDVSTMFLLALPICALYFGAVGVSALLDRARDRRAAPQAPAPESSATARP